MGEKPSKYFLNLESRNFTSKVISKLVNENGEEYTETQDKLNYQKLYYKNLYTESLNFDDISLSEKIGENPKKMSDSDFVKLEGEITYNEIAHALKNMKNEKSPGNDGFTAEFFNFFLARYGTLYSKLSK